MRRTRLKRGPWRKRKDRIARPGETTPPPTNAAWKKLCRQVRERDGHQCRRCGQRIESVGAINHIIPRRLCANLDEANRLENLALLDESCHAIVTGTIEPALYSGKRQDVFYRYLLGLTYSGPVPDNNMIAAALTRVGVSLRQP